MIKLLIDTDILIKGAAFNILRHLPSAIPAEVEEIGVLGASRFVVPKRLARAPLNGSAVSAAAVFEEFLINAHLLEPTEQESLYAAEMELAAQRNGLGLDGGESQLFAILIVRGLSAMATGDKRAIYSLERLIRGFPLAETARGKIICLEQLIRCLVKAGMHKELRVRICAEAILDKALSICLACHSANATEEECLVGLTSYIEALREEANCLLAK